MNVRVKKFFKRIFWLLISLVILSYIALQTTYYLALKDVKYLLIPSQNVYSETIKEVTWVEYQGRGEIEIVRNTPLSYMMKFFVMVYQISEGSRDLTDGLDNSDRLVSYDARLLIGYGQKLKWHAFSSVSASIWISQNFTEDEVIATILDNSYFGNTIISISDAAYVYFDKTVEELSLDEIVLILATQSRPSRLSPIANPANHEKAAQRLQEKLNKNWPGKYGDYVYQRPVIVKRDEAVSIDESN